MLIPRLSIRWILGLTAAMALLFVALRQALERTEWAVAFIAFVVLSVAVFLIYGLSFLVAYAANGLFKALSPQKSSHNPFIVPGQYPPQQVPKNPIQDQQ